jgi:hypothetical protein
MGEPSRSMSIEKSAFATNAARKATAAIVALSMCLAITTPVLVADII